MPYNITSFFWSMLADSSCVRGLRHTNPRLWTGFSQLSGFSFPSAAPGLFFFYGLTLKSGLLGTRGTDFIERALEKTVGQSQSRLQQADTSQTTRGPRDGVGTGREGERYRDRDRERPTHTHTHTCVVLLVLIEIGSRRHTPPQ